MEKKIKIGLFSGSFNPIHTGHLIIANYMCQFEDLDEVWFIVSPQNPIKDKSSLLCDEHRVAMTELAIIGHSYFKHCDIELTMPRPSYTIHTLDALRAQYPENNFYLIIGADNWSKFGLWKDAKRILNEYNLIVYPRQGYPIEENSMTKKNITFSKAPIIEISSTFIRYALKHGKNMNYFIPANVYNYIIKNKLYL